MPVKLHTHIKFGRKKCFNTFYIFYIAFSNFVINVSLKSETATKKGGDFAERAPPRLFLIDRATRSWLGPVPPPPPVSLFVLARGDH